MSGTFKDHQAMNNNGPDGQRLAYSKPELIIISSNTADGKRSFFPTETLTTVIGPS